MRAAFHAELNELVADIARMARFAGQMMTNASIALHQIDLPLAGLVIADCDQMNAMHGDMERRCISLLALQAPVALLEGRHVVLRRDLAAQLAQMAIHLEGELVEVAADHVLEGPLVDRRVALRDVAGHGVGATPGEGHVEGMIA